MARAGVLPAAQDLPDFRLDRIEALELREEVFTPARNPAAALGQTSQAPAREKVVLRFQPDAVLPALARQLQDTKYQYGWTQEHILPDGSLEMSFLIGDLPYLATWLLPYAGAVTILEPAVLEEHLRELARRVYEIFCTPKTC
ncbi:WYL domain-containing protein [Hymenobacter cellulosilyticus]|uniref:WYL domain-containing protein n=1 Tax=Hymenobacter cellulosilyticus TaxID=2932248 RepID=A0A8T9QJX9_9BACT|nr:WYL domain-containing protein [Hymenobacter cellulosilyticus]UOQ75083.1 WYL domain-containing protein [Hymenobacter cellulosilyticus]